MQTFRWWQQGNCCNQGLSGFRAPLNRPGRWNLIMKNAQKNPKTVYKLNNYETDNERDLGIHLSKDLNGI